ncbi:MAG TPA: LysM peptidoglycan-binding domain-containing protein, partial [Chitinophagales bacterium]|nr:LysM peptidoglycan-binding domain-containing protein [Chitinophagales bacterium]
MKHVLQVAVWMLPVCAVAQTGSYSLQDIGKYDIHQVKKGETLYSLSRKYNTTVPTLLEYNPSIVNNNLKTGSTIKVPKHEPVLQASTDNVVYKGIGPKAFLVPVYYEVAKGETLYSIGQKTQNDVEVIKLWNDLKVTNIKPGQKLIVGYAENAQTIVGTPREMPKPSAETVVASNTTPAPANTKAETTTASSTKPSATTTANTKSAATSTKAAETPKEKPVVTTLTPTTTASTTVDTKASTKSTNVYHTDPASAKLVYVNEKGICTWTRGTSESSSHYALHPTAPIGSTVSVKNMMNNR